MNLTDEAQARLERYLREVRLVVSEFPSASPGEVERDIREHLADAFRGHAAPVSLRELEDVLARLGSPEQWIPADEASWWRRAVVHLQRGPEDWRPAYAAFAFGGLGLVFPPLLVPGFLAARASLSVAGEGEALGEKRWLLYPPLIGGYAALLWLVLLGPAWLAAYLVMDLSKSRAQVVVDAQQWVRGRLAEVPGDLADVIGVGFACAVVLAAWWLVLGVVLCLRPRLPQVVFLPFADWFNRKHAAALRNLGLCLTGVCIAAVALIW